MGAAFCRLVEQAQPPGLRQFDDPVVGRLLDPMLAAMARSAPMREQVMGSMGAGVYGSQVMRTRYIDDVVTMEATLDVDQLVILGAGLDTRAYRLPALSATAVFEVDLPATQAMKRQHLHGVTPTAREVRFVPADLGRDPLAETLGAAGLDGTRPVLFLWEGVTQYLTEDAVRSTLAYVGTAAPGSAIVFTYALRDLVRAGRVQGWMLTIGLTGGADEPWLSGLEPDELPGLLGENGLQLMDHVGADEYQSRYLRPSGRRLDVNPGERAALAVV
jgi:methyltransferase (TIGR00027 family)